MNIDTIYEKIIEKNTGARYVKSDLHVHFEPLEIDEINFKNYCNDLNSIFSKYEIELVVLNVHRQQDLEILFKGISILRELHNENNLEITYIPGIELKDSSNTHFAIILNNNLSLSEIGNLLGAIGRKKTQNNMDNPDQCDIIEKNLSGDKNDIYKHFAEYKVIGFIPHPFLGDGITTKITGESLEDYVKDPLTYLWNMAIPKDNLDSNTKNSDCPKIFTETPLKYEKNENFRELGRIKVSDAHDPLNLDKIYKICPSCSLYNHCNIGYTYLKLSNKTITALKQIEYDNKSRVKYEIDNLYKQPYIQGIYVKDLFFHEEFFQFNPELNVLIGGRGTGKSYLIDIIRFACYSITDDDEYLKIFKNKLIKQLGNEGTVILFYRTKEGEITAIKNTLIIDEKAKDIEWENDVKTKIYKKYKDSPFLEIEIADDFGSIIKIDALSQTEIPRLHKRTKSLLNIVDSFIKVFKEKESRKLNINAINELKPKLLELYTSFNMLLEKKEDLIDKKLKLMDKKQYLNKLKDLNLENYQDLLKINLKIINHKEETIEWLENINQTINFQFNSEIFSDLNSKTKEELPDLIILYGKLYKNIIDFQEKIRKEIENVKNDFIPNYDKIIDIWNKYFEAKYQEYKDILAAHDKDFIESVQQDTINLEIQVNKLQNELKQFSKRKQQIMLLEIQIFDLGKKVFENTLKMDIRRRVALKRIETKLHNLKIDAKIKLKRSKSIKKSSYYKWLRKVTKSRAKDLDKNIHNKYYPFELAKAITSGKISQIAKNFPKGQIKSFQKLENLILNYYSPKGYSEALIELFKISIDNNLQISFRRSKSKYHFPLNRLSIGERCAVLLYLILLVEELPFLVDQADSELDQESTQRFSEYLLQIKENRQIIIATHNPNIPTLGDVDLLYYLDTEPSENREKGIIRKSGGFEECIEAILQLEGGREAIKKRFKKYDEKFFD